MVRFDYPFVPDGQETAVRVAGMAPVTGALPGFSCSRRVGANEVVFMDGDMAREVYEVVEGVVRLCKVLADGRRVVLGFVYPGELFGLSPAPQYRCTAEAVTVAMVRSCPRPTLEAAAEGSAELRARLAEQVWRELDAMQDRLLQLGRMRPLEQLASFLLVFAARRGNVPAERFRLPMTRADIADYLGLTIETVSRTMTQLRHDGVISLPNPQEVVVLRPNALRTLAQGEEFDDDSAERRPWPVPAGGEAFRAAHVG